MSLSSAKTPVLIEKITLEKKLVEKTDGYFFWMIQPTGNCSIPDIVIHGYHSAMKTGKFF
jgi:hypothetical protein